MFLDRSKSTSQCFRIAVEYRKIPKISPEDYIFQKPFLRGLVLEGLTGRNRYIFFPFLLASPKKKTNKQRERWEGRRNSCDQASGLGMPV